MSAVLAQTRRDTKPTGGGILQHPQETLKTDTVVIGAGVVGLAVGRALAAAGQQVVVLEAGPRFGEGVSSRNSEVIHAGIYYPQGSLKAELCVAGRQLLYEYCQRFPVGYRKLGKWIIATGPGQTGRLAELQQAAAANGVALDLADQSQLARALPEVRAVAGLWSAETGIISSHELMVSLLAELEQHDGMLVCQAPVLEVTSEPSGHQLEVGGATPCRVHCTRVVNAAGLGAIPLARCWQGFPADHCPQPFYARGAYFSYSGRHPFDTLVYPLPEPGGLGVHLTLDLAGQARFGPDVEWIEHVDFRVDPARREHFVQSVRRWWPALDPGRLQPAYAGVRPKLAGPNGGFEDFRILGPQQHGVPGLVQLFGIESPGLTASLAIAERVGDMLA